MRNNLPIIISVQITLHLLGGVMAQMPAAYDPAALNDLAWEYRESAFDTADSIAQVALRLARQQENGREEARAFQTRGLVAYYQGDLAQAQEWQEHAIQLFREQEDSAYIAKALNNIGSLYVSLGQCETAAKGYLEAIRLAHTMGRTDWEGIFSVGYFECLGQCEQYEVVAAKVDSVIQHLQFEGDSLQFLIGYLRNIQGFSNYILERDSLAEVHMKEGMAIGQALGNRRMYAAAINNLGALYMDTERYEEAVKWLRESIEIDMEDHARPSKLTTYVNMGQALHRLGRYEEAIPYFEEAIDHFKSTGKHNFLPNSYLAYGRTLAALEQYDAAFKAYEQSIDLRDTVHNLAMKKELARLRLDFDTERLAHELEVSQIDARQRENRLLLWMGAIVASFLVILGIYLIVFSWMRRRQAEIERRQIELEYTALRAQMNPHFIFNALNSIQGYFAEHDFIRGNEYLGTFGQLMRSVLDQSTQRTITLSQELETLNMYLQLEQMRLRSKFSYGIQLLDQLDASMITLPPLVLQPFVENAIWHGIVPKASPGHLEIKLWVEDETLYCTIMDDGIGLRAAQAQKPSQQQQRSSKGIHITRERLSPGGRVMIAEQIDANGQSHGTCVTLEIPQTDD